MTKAVFSWLFAASVLLSLAPRATAQDSLYELTVDLPAELDRVLREYERWWQAENEDSLAALFTEDGFILRPGHPPVKGRNNIRKAYASSGGALHLEAFDYEIDGDAGFIIGGYGRAPGSPLGGKFILALRRGPDGRWMIAADMDNGNG